ncbi:transposase [Glaesserella parasuis]|uniref:transposase n=1 Tax=Glaesserella parasuis TaxID=738 RepID=UPI0021C1C0D6|nr:DDE-type integrase/transposase/recombinase [Glaesserella parasuis]MDE3931527.1 transposase [Glaesserella parasuis]MDE3933005.1 transposase [Glaesserella parasuis]MDE3935189.1 transposase [Glaesserella parasuis]MDE3938764.1 transposase [Glaesserella parasuis]
MAILPEVLMNIALEVKKAKMKGEKLEPIYQHGCELTGLSRATLIRQLKPYLPPSGRKERSDKGASQLDFAELKIISAAWLENRRNQYKKKMLPLGDLLDMLRANGEIKAEFTDVNTGEIRPYSESSVSRALMNAKLHPDQLLRPKPAIRMRSLHPNHCWQIDPSLCVLYYLKRTHAENKNGLQVMEEKRFYKNKPENVAKVESDRVWRYVVTDHHSGTIYVEYVYGGETSENLCNVFINAMQRKETRRDEPFCGVPKMVMLDPGSANKSAMFDHLCYQLGVHKQVNEPGNPRAKGQVEKANDIVERLFESCLRFKSVANIDELNEQAHEWMRDFNTHRKHSRHNMPRYKAWLHITADQLVLAPSVALCRELMVSKLVERQVDGQLQVKFEGRVYDVSKVPNLNVGDKLRLGKNPYRPQCIQVECFEQVLNEKGEMELEPYWFVVEPIETDKFGFDVNAAIIGESYKSHAKTQLETHREEVERLAYGVTDDDALKQAKKANAPLFNGRIDPFKTIKERPDTVFIPKKGQEHELTTNARRVEQKPVCLVECAKALKGKFPEWSGKHYKHLAKHFPDGVAVELLDLWLQGVELPEILNPETKVLQLKVA